MLLRPIVSSELFGVQAPTEHPTPEPPDPEPSLKPPLPPSGENRLVFHGETRKFKTQKDLYVAVFERLGSLDAEFLPRYAEETVWKSAKGTWYQLSRNRASIRVGNHAQLSTGWWLDTNLSAISKEKRIKKACEVAGLRYGHDLIVRFARNMGMPG